MKNSEGEEEDEGEEYEEGDNDVADLLEQFYITCAGREESERINGETKEEKVAALIEEKEKRREAKRG